MPKIQKVRQLEEVPRLHCGRSSRAEEAVPAVPTTCAKGTKSQKCLKHEREREHEGSTRHEDRSILPHTQV